jgi:predicted Rossmann-fold nucleotide-binding protein
MRCWACARKPGRRVLIGREYWQDARDAGQGRIGSMLRKLPIVGVFGHGASLTEERVGLARSVGAMIAQLDAHLLTGGGYGVMEAAAEGFVAVTERVGLSIGIIPCKTDGPLDSPNRSWDGRPYPNPSIELAIFTPLPPRAANWQTTPARNHINIFTPHAIIALPGGAGTRNELDMAAFYRDESGRRRDDRRTILLGPIDEFAQHHRQMFLHAASLGDAERHIARTLAAAGFSSVPERSHARID